MMISNDAAYSQSEREQEPGPEQGEDVQLQQQQLRWGEGAQEEQESSGEWAQAAGVPDIELMRNNHWTFFLFFF